MDSHRVSRRQLLAAAGTAGLGALAGCVKHLPVSKGAADGDGNAIYVDPSGGFLNDGTDEDPLGSIDRAVSVANPGDTVHVRPGEYVELVNMSASGTAAKPITLTGPPDAVLKPPEGEESPVLELNGDHLRVTGLTITGLHDSAAPGDPASYHPDKLVSINGNVGGPDDYREGLVVSPHRLGNAGQSLINSVQFRDSVIGGFEVIGPAGTKWILDDTEGHNGEIVYLGTAPDNREKRGYDGYDRTRNVRVHHIDNSEGHPHSELVDCKAGVENVTVEYCTDGGGAQTHEGPNQRAISLDGRSCTVRWNVIHGVEGDGVRIGPQNVRSDLEFLGEPTTEYDRSLGTDNAIYGNVVTGCTQDAVNFLRESKRPERDTNPLPADQRALCGNRFDAYSDGAPGQDCPGDVPAGDGVGHLGGDSPWDGDVPTREAAFAARANNQHLDVQIPVPSVTTGESFEIPVSVTNNADVEETVSVRLRAGGYYWDDRGGPVPAGDTRQFIVSDRGLREPGELDVMVNGQKFQRVYVHEDG
jgi:hypothetical protein